MKQTILRSAAAGGLRVVARTRVAIDRRRADPAAARLLDVIDRWLGGRTDTATSDVIARIEARREALSASDERLTIIDYGAGRHSDTRTDEEMSAGVEVASTVGDTCRRTSKPPRWARLLHLLVAEYRPAVALELGTSLGISGAYQAAALRGGRLLTLEGSPDVAAVAEGTFAALGLEDRVEVVVGRFSDTLGPTLSRTAAVDYAFVDGHHDEHATLTYLEELKGHLSDGALVVFDDIHWSPGMSRAWSAIVDDPDVGLSVDLTELGVAVVGTDQSGEFDYLLKGS